MRECLIEKHFNYRIIIISTFILFFICVSAAPPRGTCSNGRFTFCDWATWDHWGECSNGCGTGVRTRVMLICCPPEIKLNNISKCVVDLCKFSMSQYQEDVTCTSTKYCSQVVTCRQTKCRNGGRCTDTSKGYQCSCPLGFSGRNCERVSTCSDHPCRHGLCRTIKSGYNCTCDPGYTGKNCERVATCRDSPCQHGHCQDVKGGYRCTCDAGYTGKNCENVVTCSDRPCRHGHCQAVRNGYTCTCDPGYAGKNCDREVTCSDKPCEKGTCHGGAGGYSCTCPPGFAGRNCERAAVCKDRPCLHGTCTDSSRGFHCSCDALHTGRLCETAITCSRHPCQHGTCKDTPHGFTCVCDVGYKGNTCNNLLTCSDNPCKNGTCRDGSGGYHCTCTTGFTGRNCERGMTCRDNPCRHGSCIDNRNGFTCVCPPNYTGVTCDTLISCSRHPCLHGACRDTSRGFSCMCDHAFKGDKCEKSVKCSDNPCRHGFCKDAHSGYICVCPATYKGRDCEIMVNCSSHPCLHGTCRDTPRGFSCTCDTGFSGEKCDNHTVVTGVASLTTINLSGKGTGAAGYPVDLCKTISCGHGKCISALSNVFCVCNPGFIGKYCNKGILHTGSHNVSSAGNSALTTNAHVGSTPNNNNFYKTSVSNNGLNGHIGSFSTTHHAPNGYTNIGLLTTQGVGGKLQGNNKPTLLYNNKMTTHGSGGAGQHHIASNNIGGINKQHTTGKNNGNQNTHHHPLQTPTSGSYGGNTGSNNKIPQNIYGQLKSTSDPGNSNVTNVIKNQFGQGSASNPMINTLNQNGKSSATTATTNNGDTIVSHKRNETKVNEKHISNAFETIWPFGIVPTMVGVAIALSILATTAICCFFFWKRWSDKKKKKKKKFKRWDKKIRPLPPTRRPRPIHRF